MGCTESILSEMAAKSNQNFANRSSKNNTKVEPAPLRSENNLEDARERRRRMIAERRAKSQEMAQTISENAMIEKERMSNSTWMSWKSGCHSDALSPSVTISVPGSDGTGSPDNLPNPATAYKVDDNKAQDKQEDINANEMQIRTMTLPNQVEPAQSETANERVAPTEDGEKGKDGQGHGRERRGKEQGTKEGPRKESLEAMKGGDSVQGQNRLRMTHQDTAEERERRLDDGGKVGENERQKSNRVGQDNKSRLLKDKQKAKGKHKAHVKFIDQVMDGGESLDTGRKSTSQGR